MKLEIKFGFGIEYRGDGSAILGHEQVAGMEQICLRAVSLFGGYTRYDTFGAWRDPDTKVLVTEAGCTISILTTDTQHDLTRRIASVVEQIKNSLHQKAVAVTYTKVETNIF